MRYVLIEERQDDCFITEFSDLQKAKDAFWLAKGNRENIKVRLAETFIWA